MFSRQKDRIPKIKNAIMVEKMGKSEDHDLYEGQILVLDLFVGSLFPEYG